VDSRPYLDSDGCIVIDNRSLEIIAGEIIPGQTSIVLSPQALNWVSAESQQGKSAPLMEDLMGWKAAWEARDNNGYLAYYADDFSDLRRNRKEWASYKIRVNDGKRYIKVSISDVSMLEQPEDNALVRVRYYQNYESDDYRWKAWKEQLWREGKTGWQIIYEVNG
jgi:murein L,D-transpeptidase YafK